MPLVIKKRPCPASVAACILLSFLANPVVRADWPDRVFAPYYEIGVKVGPLPPAQLRVLAFIVSDEKGNPVWDGRPLRALADTPGGPPIIVSFGGEAGKELALSADSAETLARRYLEAIQRYRVAWADFDIEGPALADSAANERRNAALARIQAARPELRVTFTLPVDPDGLSRDSLSLLRDARARGVRIASVNLMIMDYLPRFLTGGKTMGELSIASALEAHRQLAPIDPSLRIGLTALAGANDVPSETFTADDARALVAWARFRPWINWLSYWRMGRADAMCAPAFAAWASGR